MSAARPWHDCPACPSCGSTCGIPKREAHRADELDETHTLACPACGVSWVGSTDDVATAERASAAWKAERDRERRALVSVRREPADTVCSLCRCDVSRPVVVRHEASAVGWFAFCDDCVRRMAEAVRS